MLDPFLCFNLDSGIEQIVLLLVAAVASLIPAWRAPLLNPNVTLRDQ